MVTTGFSRIHVSEYKATGGKVTYSNCRELARAKSMSIDVATSDENKFYANNRLAEVEPAAFESGTLKLVVDGLSGEEEALILGITETTMTVGEKSVPVVKFGKAVNPPYLGIGGVKRMQMNGVVSFRPVIFCKARFAMPADAAETQEEKINYQTQELSAAVMRDDTPEENWKIIPKEGFPTEDEAVAFIKAVFNAAASAAQGGEA